MHNYRFKCQRYQFYSKSIQLSIIFQTLERQNHMSKSLNLPIRDTWKDTGLEFLSILIMFVYFILEYIIWLTGLKYFGDIVLFFVAPKRVMDITETSTSDLVYCSWLICCHRVTNPSFQKISVDGIDVYFIKHNQKNYICFYANNPFALLDLRKEKVDDGYLRYGLGYYIEQFHIVKQKMPIDNDPLVITGHGAGGSIATLFSWFYDKQCHVYVFGAYPMGDIEYCNQLTCDLVEKDIIIHRYISELDIFATFPSSPNPKASPDSFMNYDFIGNTVRILKDDKVTFDPDYMPDSITHTLPKYYYFAIKNIEQDQQSVQNILFTTQSSLGD